MLDLRDILELIDDTFNDGSLAQDELVMQGDQTVLHVLSQAGNELNAKGLKEQFKSACEM